MPVDTGDSVGRYVLGRRLGAGGMGAVYLAMDGGLRVAIKIPYGELLADDYALNRFRDEALAGSIVSHPNIARVLDHGATSSGLPYLVMEYVPGERLGARTLPPLRQSATIVQRVLEGLGALHAADIVHGDVKTDNIIVGRHGVKLIDFGLAHVSGVVSMYQIVSGTPDYMAPEVIRGEGSTAASDIYAAGVILYELITGETPFSGGDSAEIVRRHLNEQVVPPSLRRIDVEVPASLERIVMRALAKHPKKRPSSAVEFAAALEVTSASLDDRIPARRRHERPARHAMRTTSPVPRAGSHA